MPRLPIVQVETGPLVAPALAMANQIREGRARVAISEETAKNAPESQRLALGQQKATLEDTQLGTEEKRYKLDREKSQAPMMDMLTRLEGASRINKYAGDVWQNAKTPEAYDKYRATFPEEYRNLMPELSPEERTPAGFQKKRQAEFDNTLKNDKDIRQEMMRQQGQTEREKLQQTGADRRQGMADKTREAIAAEDRAEREARYGGLDDRVIQDMREKAYDAWLAENVKQYGNQFGDPDEPEDRKPGFKPYTSDWIKNYMETNTKGMMEAKRYSRQLEGTAGAKPKLEW